MNKPFSISMFLIFMVAAPLLRTGLAVAAEDDRSTSREVREREAEQMVKDDLSSFQQSDDHGGLLFSFRRDHIDLTIRSAAGDEAVILHGSIRPLNEIKDDASKNKENNVP